jgi:protein KRI1
MLELTGYPLRHFREAHIIATHPRTIPTVRRADTARKDAREKKKERKAEKLLAKREEVKRLKALKMREIREKLEKVRAEGGLGKPSDGESKGKQKAEDDDWEDEDWGALGELDLEGDWDPEKHDAQMRSLYAEGGEYEVRLNTICHISILLSFGISG